MLKIRVDNQPEIITLYVEGKLVGDCVDELRRVWTTLRTESPTKPTTVELSSVRVVDVTGRKLLTQMHEWGSQLAGSGLVIGSLINEIRSTRNQAV
jgi:ABC-type transporter Mla MlaB component